MASETSWINVKNILKKTFGLGDGRIGWLAEVRNCLSALASAGIPTAPDFTLHSDIHSDNLVLLLGRLREHFPMELSEYETDLLVTSAYIHDIGMFFGEARFKEVIIPNWNQCLGLCPRNLCDDCSQYQVESRKDPVSAQIRAVHHLLTAYLIAEDGDTLFRLSGTDKPHIIAICRGHRKANLNERRCDCYQNKEAKLGLVRRDLLAALLRLADALDYYPERAPEEVFRTRAWDFLQHPIALENWLIHYFATSIRLAKADNWGNPYLDCQILYNVPAKKTLSGIPYEQFFAPLFNKFLEDARRNDFDVKQYPSALLEMLGIKDIRVDFKVSPEPGAALLPTKVITEIEASGCRDVLAFIRYLDSKGGNGAKPQQSIPVIDRRPELRVFECILDGDDPQHRLMLLVGDHGQGKTWLMSAFERMTTEKRIAHFRVDLAEAIESSDILDGIWLRLGASQFPAYSALRKKQGQMETKTLEERTRVITELFLAEWQAISDRPRLILLLDSYERAAPMLRNWIERSLLEGLNSIEEVIIIIGGQLWPKIDDYWHMHGYQFPLLGVKISDYKEYAEQRGISIPEAELMELHRKFDGLPKLFKEFVDGRAQVGV